MPPPPKLTSEPPLGRRLWEEKTRSRPLSERCSWAIEFERLKSLSLLLLMLPFSDKGERVNLSSASGENACSGDRALTRGRTGERLGLRLVSMVVVDVEVMN